MVRRVAAVALVACTATALGSACSTFSSSGDGPLDGEVEGGEDGRSPVGPPAPPGDAGAPTASRDGGAADVLVSEAQDIGALVADEKAVVYSTAAGVKLYDRAQRCVAVVTTDSSDAIALTATDVFFVRGTNEIVRARR